MMPPYRARHYRHINPALPRYVTPHNTICCECREPTTVIPLDNSFDYAGTHCTHGRSGTHYPADYGVPVSSCCQAPCLHNGVEIDREGAEVYEYDDFPDPKDVEMSEASFDDIENFFKNMKTEE